MGDQIDRRRAGEGRGAQLRHPEEPPRVRRRDERAAQDGLQDPPAAPPRHLHAGAHRRRRQAHRQDARDQGAAQARRRGEVGRRADDRPLRHAAHGAGAGRGPSAAADEGRRREGALLARFAPRGHLQVLGLQESTSRRARPRNRRRSTSAFSPRSRSRSPSSASACWTSWTASWARSSKRPARRASRRRTGTGRGSATGSSSTSA